MALHWQILIGMAAGIAIGFALKNVDGSEKFVLNWVYPIGKIFVNLLKLIAVPLIIASLTKGIADLQDISKLSKIGGRTIGTYLVTTVIAVTLGLVVVNTLQPGVGLSQVPLMQLVLVIWTKVLAK